MVLSWLLFLVGLILFLIGLGFSLRWLSFMVRGVGVAFMGMVMMVVVGAFGLMAGFILMAATYHVATG